MSDPAETPPPPDPAAPAYLVPGYAAPGYVPPADYTPPPADYTPPPAYTAPPQYTVPAGRPGATPSYPPAGYPLPPGLPAPGHAAASGHPAGSGYPTPAGYPPPAGYPSPAGYPVPTGYPAPTGYSAPAGYPGQTGYPGPAGQAALAYPREPARATGGRMPGLVAFVLSVVAALGASLVGGIAGYNVAFGAARQFALTAGDLEFDWSVLTPVRDWVLLGEVSFWAGTVLGIWALVQGIIAIVKVRGRGWAIAAVTIAVLGPVVFGVVLQATLTAGLGAGVSLA